MGVVDEIKERLDIVEVISASVPLQKTGRNFKALCPFHAEKTPSFYVFPESQRWHCFGGCAEGGDVFSFAMKREGWDFPTTLEELARRAGVELRPRAPAEIEREERVERLRAAMAEAASYYHRLLLHAPEAEEARAYVARRGLTSETVECFQLGYSLPGWEGLRTHLGERDFTVAELVAAGLLVEREDGTSYDRFRDRLMIPIRDPRGCVIGFGARTLDPDGVPKYINSPQTALFDKSRTLFGLDLARQTIRQEDRVVVVEGYMDVMRAYQQGFRNVVAQMGTALTEAQVRRLQRFTRRFVLALDPDAAGMQATLRGLEVARETLVREGQPVFDPRGLVGFEGRLGAEIRILSLPSGYDPDELIGSDPDQWVRLVEGALPVVEALLQRLLAEADLDDAKERARIVEEMLPALRDVVDPVEREVYAQKIARTLQVQERTVLSRLHRAERRAAQAQSDQVAASSQPLGLAPADLEGYCLAILFRRPLLLDWVNSALEEMALQPLQPRDFADPAGRALFETWHEMVEQGAASAESLRERLPPAVAHRLDAFLGGSQNWADEQWAREVLQAVLRLRKRNLHQTIAELQVFAEEAGRAAVEGEMKEHTRARRRIDQALARHSPAGRAGK